MVKESRIFMWDFIKKVFKDICSAVLDFFLFTTGFILCIAFIGGLIAGKFLPAIIMGLIGLGLCIFGSRKLWLPRWHESQAKAKALPPVKSTALSETSDGNTVSDFAQESYEKAVADYNHLNEIIRQLSDKELIGQLEKMQAIAFKMLNYMKYHPEKVALADQFINYYQDRALSLSQQFLEFEEMNLNTPEINQLKAKTKITLESFDEAYEAQFSRMVSDKIMEMESELQVARQIMSDAGISNNAPHSSQPADIPREEPANSDNLDFRIDRPFEACKQKQGCHVRPRGRFQK